MKEALSDIQKNDVSLVAFDPEERPHISGRIFSHPDSISGASKSSETNSGKPNPYDFSAVERPVDPTMPQNRPSANAAGKITAPLPPPTMERLKYLSLLDLLAHRDKSRGGPGRISWEEFENIMKGPKGLELGFVGSWMEMVTF